MHPEMVSDCKPWWKDLVKSILMNITRSLTLSLPTKRCDAIATAPGAGLYVLEWTCAPRMDAMIVATWCCGFYSSWGLSKGFLKSGRNPRTSGSHPVSLSSGFAMWMPLAATTWGISGSGLKSIQIYWRLLEKTTNTSVWSNRKVSYFCLKFHLDFVCLKGFPKKTGIQYHVFQLPHCFEAWSSEVFDIEVAWPFATHVLVPGFWRLLGKIWKTFFLKK